jgi:hypothetical protein
MQFLREILPIDFWPVFCSTQIHCYINADRYVGLFFMKKTNVYMIRW